MKRRAVTISIPLAVALVCLVGCAPAGSAPAESTTSPAPTLKASSGSSIPSGTPSPTGISGHVLRNACPPSAQPTCGTPGMPVSALISVLRRQSTAPVASTRSDQQGAYQVAVPPGDYTVRVTPDDQALSCQGADVTVTAGDLYPAEISCT